MFLPLKLASKYIFSKKNKTFINFLSIFSIASLSIGTAAMVIILSVFNGLEESLKSIYRDFDPDIKIISKDKIFFKNKIIFQHHKELKGSPLRDLLTLS